MEIRPFKTGFDHHRAAIICQENNNASVKYTSFKGKRGSKDIFSCINHNWRVCVQRFYYKAVACISITFSFLSKCKQYMLLGKIESIEGKLFTMSDVINLEHFDRCIIDFIFS